MSFDLGPVKRPLIQESKNIMNNGGGGGSLGYMSNEENDDSENQKKQENNTHLLEKSDDIDMVDISVKDSEFESEDDLKLNFKPKDFIDKIAGKIFKSKKQTKSNPFE